MGRKDAGFLAEKCTVAEAGFLQLEAAACAVVAKVHSATGGSSSCSRRAKLLDINIVARPKPNSIGLAKAKLFLFMKRPHFLASSLIIAL